MTDQKTQIRVNIIAFILLFAVSLYRRLSLAYLPGDPFRTYILYACYVILIASWAISIRLRVTQKGMRLFLMLEASIMFAGLTIRFLQDTFWQEHILLMRVSGLCIEATILPMVLVGLYATLGTGQADDYRIPRKWYLLLIPALLITMAFITDERHHFMNYIVPEEPQPNLIFHPNVGTFIMAGMTLALMTVRVFLIYRRNKLPQYRGVTRLIIPFMDPLILSLLSFEYFVVSLGLVPALAGKEVIELYAKIYYAEVLTWEIYIYLGLVPVNTGYSEIFRNATVGMQIIMPDGGTIISQKADPVTREQLETLEKHAYITVKPGQELHAHHFAEGTLLWNKDVSRVQDTIDALNRSAEELAQEGVLLEEELRTRNQEQSLFAKNQIYNELTADVKIQLGMMKQIAEENPDSDNVRLRQLVLLGTYIKRRCNLRLIQKEEGLIHEDDLLLSIRDMQEAMRGMGIQSTLNWAPGKTDSADFSIRILDTLENLLEQDGATLSYRYENGVTLVLMIPKE